MSGEGGDDASREETYGAHLRSPWRRQLRDRQVIAMRLIERLPWAEITLRDGRTERQLRRIVADYEERAGDDGLVAASALQRDPVQLIEAELDRLEMLRDSVVGIMLDASTDAVALGAARTWLAVEQQYVQLLQAVGKLPKELGTFRHLLDVRELAIQLDRLLDGLESGERTPAEARAQVYEWACEPCKSSPPVHAVA
jgi:hypothetical protein